MKRVVILLLFCIISLSLQAQFMESRSGYLAFNISKQPSYAASSSPITITTPLEDIEVVANDKYNLLATVQSPEPIKKIMIFRNGSFINGYLSNTIKQTPDGSTSFEEPIPLKLGINDIKIEAYTKSDTVVKNITVEYNLYAARNFALLIGNNQYDDPLITELDKPVRDVEELYSILTRDYNFNEKDVVVLKNETKANIIGTLHKLRSMIGPEDNLLIFYAGHGTWDEGMGVGYWLPKDALKDNPSNWIPNTDLTNYLGAIKAKHTLLIADACFSGGIFKSRSGINTSYAIEQLYQYNSRKAITSGLLTIVPDNSVFFQYLSKSLRENKNDYLSSEDLFSNMRMAVINNGENIPQYGTIQNVGDEGGDFIFIKKR